MTKQEVRAAALAKLGAAGAKVLYDVGAGTGSVSVELSLMAGQADVYAIECEEKAVELIGKNRERFGCGNLHVVFGKAPQALDFLRRTLCLLAGRRGICRKFYPSFLKKIRPSGSL